jgi:SAM-dependent methyltransferase
MQEGTPDTSVRIGRAAHGEALERAQQAAHVQGEYVEQQSFMQASEIRELAQRASIRDGTRVLDLCCGIGGPGRFLTRELGCDYLGVDRDAGAIHTARARARGLPCRFEIGQVPPVPRGTYDVVLLLETMLAFKDKQTLVHEIAGALDAGGRFAFTLEAGRPLTAAERDGMPNADRVWPAPFGLMRRLLERAGLRVRWLRDSSASHRATAASLLNAYAADAPAIAPRIGQAELADLLAAHRLWVQWLDSGRVRKLSVVAEKTQAIYDGRRATSPDS